MSLSTLQVKVAKVYTRLAKNKGVTITYSQKGETGVTIYGFYGSQTTTMDMEVGLQADKQEVVFTIPYQTNCTLAPPPDSIFDVTGDQPYSVVSSTQLGHGTTPAGWRVVATCSDVTVNKVY